MLAGPFTLPARRFVTVGALVMLCTVGRPNVGLAYPACPALALDGLAASASAQSSVYPGTAFTPFTVEAWFYAAPERNGYFVIASDDAYDLMLWKDNATWGISVALYTLAGRIGWLETNFYFPTLKHDAWNHVALTFDPAVGARVAVNGQFGSTHAVTGTFNSYDSGFVVGGWQGMSSTGAFSGFIDEVRVSNVVRYNATFTPSPTLTGDANTLALFHFAETPDATSFADSSGHGVTLTAAGTAHADVSPTCTVTPPVITLQPTGFHAGPGSFGALLVAATGVGLSYQWQVSADAGHSWTDVNGAGSSGATTTRLSLSNISAGLNLHLYRCVVTNFAGAIASRPAVLRIGVEGFDIDLTAGSDFVVYRPSTGYWHIYFGNLVNAARSYQWGSPLNNDVPVIGDFDGDARKDLVVYRPATGQWFIRHSSLDYDRTQFGYFQWGEPGDTPLSGDFDGDGFSDIVVYRGSTGHWLIRYSSLGYAVNSGTWDVQWGASNDVPKTADFDGDGKTDIAVYRPSTGQWFIRYSSRGFDSAQFGHFVWGSPGDVPLAGDFDGDGISDIAFYRPTTGHWYIRRSSSGYVFDASKDDFAWGALGDVPKLADFDGDGKLEITVYRPTTGQWFYLRSKLAFDVAEYVEVNWGAAGDITLP